jgi:hypothetical protein
MYNSPCNSWPGNTCSRAVLSFALAKVGIHGGRSPGRHRAASTAGRGYMPRRPCPDKLTLLRDMTSHRAARVLDSWLLRQLGGALPLSSALAGAQRAPSRLGPLHVRLQTQAACAAAPSGTQAPGLGCCLCTKAQTTGHQKVRCTWWRSHVLPRGAAACALHGTYQLGN